MVTCIFVSEAVLMFAIRAEHAFVRSISPYASARGERGGRSGGEAGARRRSPTRSLHQCASTVANMRRTIPDPHSLAPDAIMKSAQSDTVLEAANMAQMVGVLQQLGKLATYSHELFTDLTIEAEGSLTRINQLKGRLGRVTERLARVDDALAAASETEIANICAANPGGAAW